MLVMCSQPPKAAECNKKIYKLTVKKQQHQNILYQAAHSSSCLCNELLSADEPFWQLGFSLWSLQVYAQGPRTDLPAPFQLMNSIIKKKQRKKVTNITSCSVRPPGYVANILRKHFHSCFTQNSEVNVNSTDSISLLAFSSSPDPHGTVQEE